MKDIKNYLIAILAGLLVLTLSTHSAQSAPKQYDPVILAEYSACLGTLDYEQFRFAGREAREACQWWYPPKYAKPPLSPIAAP